MHRQKRQTGVEPQNKRKTEKVHSRDSLTVANGESPKKVPLSSRAKLLIINDMKKSIKSSTTGVNSMASAHQVEAKTQFTKYHTKGGQGTGFEDACAAYDRRCGKTVDMCGRDNSFNGPDRIVDGVKIQSKCYQNASGSFSSAFDKTTGQYRYSGMKLEVPSDQYAEVVVKMREAIIQGKVPGVTDPNQASQIVVKGHYTYAQARNITKAGNIDSIKFDIQIQATACAFACGISAGIAFFIELQKGASVGDALKEAAKTGGKTAGVTMLGGVVAQQFLRTGLGRNCAATATKVIKPVVKSAMKTQVGKSILAKTASVVAGKQISGAAAANVLTKAARTNAIVSSVMFAVTTIPDVVNTCRGKMTVGECVENTACNASGIGGGIAGASAGAAFGTIICPGVGTALGGLLGGIAGGMGASTAVRKIFSVFK